MLSFMPKSVRAIAFKIQIVKLLRTIIKNVNLDMENIGYIEIKISGFNGNMKLTPETFDNLSFASLAFIFC